MPTLQALMAFVALTTPAKTYTPRHVGRERWSEQPVEVPYQGRHRRF